MSCENVRPLISSLIDRRISGRQLEEALAHLETCRTCSSEYEALRENRESLRAMAASPAPLILQQRLQVLASHQRARRLARINWRTRLEFWQDIAMLKFDNLWRPVALPIAGGLVSALLLFSVLIPSVSFAHITTQEPPSPVFTEPDGQVTGEGEWPRLESANDPGASGKIVVVLLIDERGRVRDYRVTQGKMTPEVQNFILFSVFTPATMFGKPTWGQVKAVFGPDNGLRG